MPGTTFSSAASLGPAYRALAWEQTPLGAPDGWPSELRTALGLVLETRFPAAIFWGHELVVLYNEAFVPLWVTSTRGPGDAGAGRLRRGVGRPRTAAARRPRRGPGHLAPGRLHTAGARRRMCRTRGVTSSYSPVRDEAGAVLGVLDLAVETSAQVLGLRRLEALRTLDASLASATDAADVAERTRVARADGDADLAPSSGAVSAVVDQFHLLVEAAAAAATARVDARAARRRSEARTQGVLESMPTASAPWTGRGGAPR